VSWIGVDFDGTLAQHHPGNGLALGHPVPAMMARVQAWLAEGQEVRIVTARASARQWGCAGAVEQIGLVQAWCVTHGLPVLEVTCEKDYEMEALWDDKCITVEINTGLPLTQRRNTEPPEGFRLEMVG